MQESICGVMVARKESPVFRVFTQGLCVMLTKSYTSEVSLAFDEQRQISDDDNKHRRQGMCDGDHSTMIYLYCRASNMLSRLGILDLWACRTSAGFASPNSQRHPASSGCFAIFPQSLLSVNTHSKDSPRRTPRGLNCGLKKTRPEKDIALQNG